MMLVVGIGATVGVGIGATLNVAQEDAVGLPEPYEEGIKIGGRAGGHMNLHL